MALSGLPLRRIVLFALAAGLSLAAIVAIAAILTRSFDDTDVRLIATSIGFSVFCSLGAAGARAERLGSVSVPLARATTAAAAISFGLLLVGLWSDRLEFPIWRAFGTAAVATLAASHTCLVLSAARGDDSPLIRGLVTVSVASAWIDAVLGVVAIVHTVGRIDLDYLRLLGVLVIVMLLSTALPLVLRRLAAAGEGRPDDRLLDPRSHQLLAIAARLDELVSKAGAAGAQLRKEAVELRRIADDRDI